ncbi:MAG: HAD family hydrolase [Myxococcota bacterium]
MLVLDFDGTVTDAEQEGRPYRDGYLGDLAVLTGRPPAEIAAMAKRFESEVAAQPDRHGWRFGDHIVAPAMVDPYLRIMPVARKILDACDAFREREERARLLDGILYKYNYQKTEIAFRPGARELLLALAERSIPVHVVTNSHTEPVQNKIRSLAHGNEFDWLIARVHGRAKKYVIDPGFTAVAEAMNIAGLSRPILLRRRHYHDVLRGLLDSAGEDWSDLVVIGDIFELDLALPLTLGARIGLVCNDFTPAYEREFVGAHPRGRLIAELAEVIEVASA